MQCPCCGALKAELVSPCNCGCNAETPLESKEPELFTMFGATLRGPEVIRTQADDEGNLDDANLHIRRSIVFACVISMLAMLLLLWSHVSTVSALLVVSSIAYSAWSAYWGFLSIGNFWVRSDDSYRVPGWMKVVMRILFNHLLTFAIPFFAGALLYSVLGGGIREFFRYRKIV